MKKLITLGIIMGLVIGTAVASTNEVTSVNAAGFAKVTLERGKYKLMAINFDMVDGNHVITNVINAVDVPAGTIVYFWDESQQKYTATETRKGFPVVKWDPGTNVLERGMCFWIYIPPSAPNPTYEITIRGQVPAESSVPITLVPGFTFAGYPFSTDRSITNTSLGTVAKRGDIVYLWRNNGWVSETWKTFPPPSRWDPGTNVISLLDGFLYRSTATTNKVWTETKPYVWP